MEPKYLYPYWGSEHMSADAFVKFAVDNGFDGIEMNVPDEKEFQAELLISLHNIRQQRPDFVFVAQQVFGIKDETPSEYLLKVLNRLGQLRKFKPTFINSHTGKDHYSFEDNCHIISAIEDFSRTTNVPVYHELHRGRFTFHSATTLRYLEVFPNLKFVGDFSHWCVTSESMLEDQQDCIARIIPHIHHIHARVGSTQSAQVNHPFALEWQNELDIFVNWWQRIIDFHHGSRVISVTPEFGPYPYMPHTPFDQKPLANQAELNLKMTSFLKQHLKQLI